MSASANISIVRSRPTVEFTSLPNRIANDEKLSARALGVLYYILSKPADWQVIPAQLGQRFGLSYRVVLKVLNELGEAGYLKRDLIRNASQQIIGIRYLVSDEPCVDFAACGESRQTEKRHPYKEQKDTKPLPLTPSPGAAQLGLAKKQEKAIGPPSRSRWRRDDGEMEKQIASRLGPHGWDVLMGLPPATVNALCARQRMGTLDDMTVCRLREGLQPP